LRLGWLEVRPVGHLLAVLGIWLMVLIVSGTSQLGLVLLGYALLAGPRLLHELGHAFVGRWCGRRVERLVWTPLATYVRFGEAANGRAGRLSALAGPLSQSAAGGLLLVFVGTVGQTWSATMQELVLLLATLHVSGLANLVPAPGLDGWQVFDWSLRKLPWPAQVTALVVPILLLGLLDSTSANLTIPGALISAPA
jgi:Zn-dependent protease